MTTNNDRRTGGAKPAAKPTRAVQPVRRPSRPTKPLTKIPDSYPPVKPPEAEKPADVLEPGFVRIVEAFPRRVRRRSGKDVWRVIATDAEGNRYLHPLKTKVWEEARDLSERVQKRTSINVTVWTPYEHPKFGSPADIRRLEAVEAERHARGETPEARRLTAVLVRETHAKAIGELDAANASISTPRPLGLPPAFRWGIWIEYPECVKPDQMEPKIKISSIKPAFVRRDRDDIRENGPLTAEGVAVMDLLAARLSRVCGVKFAWEATPGIVDNSTSRTPGTIQ